AVFNSGHRFDGTVPRCQGQTTVDFSTFAPLTLALIGTLPMLLSRCVVIRMERNPLVTLPRFDEFCAQQVHDCATLWADVLCWAHRVEIDRNPPMPAGLRNRAADNWRVLFAIADSFGAEWGARARQAALALSRAQVDEDPSVIALSDIRDVFNRRKVDRMASSVLVDELCKGTWGEWRGPKDDQTPHQPTQGGQAQVLRPLSIRP